ncbi:MAG TPA: ABC transporter permease [Steroidobacteraceae bacterium]|nr:ABC transporter permease [Steroidobacteraceae bacterium]
MKYFPLVWAGLWRKPAETVLIWLAVTVSFALFGLMVGLHATYDRMIANSRLDRLYVDARFANVSPTGILMPFALREQIARVPGVSAVGIEHLVRGYYRNPSLRATVFAVDDHMQQAWPELPLTPTQWKQLAATPTGVFITRSRAAAFGLKVGDRLPLITPPGTRGDGATSWDFQVLGITPDMPGHELLIVGNLGYVDRSMPLAQQGYAWEFRVAVRDGARANEISGRIDQALANSSTPTVTIPDKIAEIDGVNSVAIASKTWPVAGAGIFLILLLTANGIAQSVRERTPEFAVLKTMGYRHSTLAALVLAEVALPCVTGAAIGLGLARLLTRLPVHYLPTDLAALPQPTLSSAIFGLSLACALGVALLGTIVPLRHLRHLSVIDALAGH